MQHSSPSLEKFISELVAAVHNYDRFDVREDVVLSTYKKHGFTEDPEIVVEFLRQLSTKRVKGELTVLGFFRLTRGPENLEKRRRIIK